MPAMKISLDAAMRARDVSQPTPADDTAAAAMLADSGGQRPAPGRPRPQRAAARQAAARQQGRPATARPRKHSRPRDGGAPG